MINTTKLSSRRLFTFTALAYINNICRSTFIKGHMIAKMAAPIMEVGKPVVLCPVRSVDNLTRGLLPEYEALLKEHFQIVWSQELEEQPHLAADIQGVVVVKAPVVNQTMRLLDQMPRLKILSNFGVGVDHIPVAELAARGIRVGNTPDVLSDATADMGMALMLASARNLRAGLNIAMGPEPVSEFPLNFLGRDVSHATLGIVGLGRIGLKVAQRAKGFQMKILYHCRNQVARDVEESVGATYFPTLHEMLPQCDYVMVCCPLTQNTVHLFGEQEFAKMKSDATIINISRGKVINQDALVKALSSNQIRGAALDVTEPEPLPRDHPLLKRDNVIIVPHFGSQTVETRMKMFQSLVANLKAVLIDGTDPPNEVKL